jgi:NTE family protein
MRRLALVALAALTFSVAAEARPKVCLVLSGGGARGAAHVGVIKVLQELHVPIDCVTGTSMGSIVGGAYATGLTVEEMEKTLATFSIRTLLEEKPPRQDQAIRRKLDDRAPLFDIEAGLDARGISLQKGAITGIGLEAVLRRLSMRPGYLDFDQLPIPYRAVATDLVTGKAVIFREGELASVMRASMSVPGAIAPAEIGDQLLVDGGLTNNLPVDVARAMGADIVIAVNLGTPLSPRESINNVFGVTSQMINILTEQNVRASLASLKPTDILIEPLLGTFSAGDFDNMPKAVVIGEAAARVVAERLAALASSPADYATFEQRRTRPVDSDTAPVDAIRFAEMKRVNPEVLKSEIETRPGVPLQPEVLDRDMRRLFGTGDFEHVNYRIVREGDMRILDIEAVEKSWGPGYLRFGLGLSYDFKGNSLFDLAASFRRTWLDSLGAEWRTDAQLGRNSLLRTAWYQPLAASQAFFVEPYAEGRRTAFDLYQDDLRVASYNMDRLRVGVDVGTEVTKFGQARLGLAGGALWPKLQSGPESLDLGHVRIDQAGIRLGAVLDQLDNVNFPRSGVLASADIFASRRALGADDNYTRWDLAAQGAVALGGNTFGLGLRGAGTLDRHLPAYDLVQWGGFLRQSGHPVNSLVGQSLTFGRFVYTYKLVDQKVFDGVYAGFSAEGGRMSRPVFPGQPNGFVASGAVFLGVDSPLGPFYLAWGRSSDGASSAYLFLGRP